MPLVSTHGATLGYTGDQKLRLKGGAMFTHPLIDVLLSDLNAILTLGLPIRRERHALVPLLD